MDDPSAPDHGARRHNRLIYEKSPYLLQHAENPVDWFPWGEEAFDRAAQEDKPVFLSIGYATCHWCHVMAHESFEDEEVAEMLNRDFICVKVDREERPDIDSAFMQVCLMMTGQGGWPLTIVMTPDKKPFFAATYIPKERRFAVMGLVELLPRIAHGWHRQRQDLLRSSEEIVNALASPGAPTPGKDPDPSLLDEGYEQLVLRFDPEYGGFGPSPKFPTPHLLLFLMRYWKRTGKKRALDMAVKTLDALRVGGICDQVGGGFHRYSTDAQWRVPHFEKMLYDQALLLLAYTEAFQATGQERFCETAEEIIAYVLRDLTSPQGAFFSAEDADSPDGEGAFYQWTRTDLEAVLGTKDAQIAAMVFNVRPSGNFSGVPGNEPGNILYRSLFSGQVAEISGIMEADLEDRMRSIRERLFSARLKRPRPSLDDKVLADGNGLFIAALAKAARVFGNPLYSTYAVRAMAFLLGHMRTPDGQLLHRYRDGNAGIPAFADDYAFVIFALLELYESTFDEQYLSDAISLNRVFMEHFFDTAEGGFFSTADTAEVLFSRKKEFYDGAIPSANSVACENLIRLSRLTGDMEYENHASALARYGAGRVQENPAAYGWFLCAMDRVSGPSQEIVIAGDTGAADTERMIALVRARYLPSCSVVFRSTSEPARSSALADLAPHTRTMGKQDGKATVYVCSGTACSAPVTDPALLGPALEGKNPGEKKD